MCLYAWHPKRHAPATFRVRWTASWWGRTLSGVSLMCEAHARRALANQWAMGGPASVKVYRFRKA